MCHLRLRYHRGLLLALGVPLALAVMVSGCGGDSTTDQSQTASAGAPSDDASSTQPLVKEAEEAVAASEEQPTDVASAELGPVALKPGSSIFWITCELAVEGCNAQTEGAEKAAKVAGYDFTSCASRANAPESVPQCFNEAANAKPDAVLVMAIGREFAASGYEQVEKAGIPIVGLFTGDPPGTASTQIAGPKLCTEEGEQAGYWAVAQTQGKANALIPYAPEFLCAVQIYEGVERVLDKCSECAGEGQKVNLANVATAFPQQLNAALLSDPDLNMIIATQEQLPLYAAEAVQAAGATDVEVAGASGGRANVPLVKSGEQGASVVTGRFEPAWIAVDAGIRLINGEKIPAAMDIIPYMTLTEDNIEEFPRGFTGAVDFEKQYEELWGIQ